MSWTWSQRQVAGLAFWYVVLADPSHRHHPKQLVHIVFAGREIDWWWWSLSMKLVNIIFTVGDIRYHDPKLVPPIWRNFEILKGMIPSSVTFMHHDNDNFDGLMIWWLKYQEPKLVPPISRQGILMGMIPSSVTLRLSLDPTTISSFRVTCVDKWTRMKTHHND